MGNSLIPPSSSFAKGHLHILHNPWDCVHLYHKYTVDFHCPLIVSLVCDFGSRRARKLKM